MTIHIVKYTKGEGVPHNNMALLAATRDESMLARVNEGIDSLLMKIERFVLFVSELLNIMNVDETVKRR
jgi:hypothetical protein